MNCMAVLECVENTVLGENHNASHCVKYLLKVRYEALLCTGPTQRDLFWFEVYACTRNGQFL